MRLLLCLLAVALLAAAPVHSRRLKFNFPSTPSTPTPPSSQCINSFNYMVQSGVCGPNSSLSQCCAALAQVGSSCLDSIVAGMEQEPAKYGQILSVTKDLRSRCGLGSSSGPSSGPSSNPSTSSSSGPSQQCINDFNAMVAGGACSQGSSMARCCPAMAAVGNACLDAIVAAMEMEPQKYADLVSITKGLRQQCGTSAGPSPGAGSGSGPIAGTGPSPGAGSGSTPVSQEQCLNGLLAAFDGGACSGSSVANCCSALNSLGSDCLNMILELSKSDMQVHNAIASLMQTCGGTSTGSSTFSAHEITAQAVVRLQAVGSAQPGAVPQETQQALLPSEQRFEAPMAQEAHSGFSHDMLVEAAA